MHATGGRPWASAVLFAAALCASCYSDSPLDPSPQIQLEEGLLGSWHCLSADPEDTETATATFTAASEKQREYLFTWQEPHKKPEPYRAFISSVRGSMFLNVRPVEEGEYTGWAFVRYSFLRPNVLDVEIADGDFFTSKESSATPAAARATLEKALLSTPTAVQEFCVCMKVVAKAAEQ